MATPRKHWFRVGDSILREPITVEQRGILVGLMAWLNQRWARDGLTPEQACTALLSTAHLAEITGRSHPEYAKKSLRSLAQLYSISLRTRGSFTEISWPKFAEFQQLASRGLPQDSPKKDRKSPPPHPQDARRKTQDAEEEEKPAPPATPQPNGAHPPLTDPQWSELRAWADAAVLAGKLDAKATDPSWLSGQVERCADYYAAKGKRIVRWPAAVRNWVRKSEELRAIYAPAKAEQQGVLAAFVARGAMRR